MKKPVIILLSILVVAFLIITILKKDTDPTKNETKESELTEAEKEKIQQFWKRYRSATEHRIAGRINEALQDYTEATALNAKHEDSWYYLGGLHRTLGNFREAENAWNKLTQVNRKSSRAFLQLGNLYIDFPETELFNIDLARERFQRALDLNKEETGSVLRLGQVELIRGDLTSAQHYFSDVTASNFKSVEGYFLNGYISWKNNDIPTAKSLFENAIKYSKPMKPVTGVMGEGDTKTGKVLGQSSLKNDQSLFDVFIDDLSVIQKPNFERQMIEKFDSLDAFLNLLKEKLR